MQQRSYVFNLTIIATVFAFCTQLALLPAPAAPNSKFERIYVKAWETIQQNYFARQKLSNWEKWKHRYAGKLGTRAQLKAALDEMTDSLGDDYTFVLSEVDLASRQKNQKSRSVSVARVMTGNVGYIKLDNFATESIFAEMKTALRKLASTEGIILDLRGNPGGFIAAAQDVFSMVADEGVFMTYDGFLHGAEDDQSFVLKKNRWNVMKNGKLSTEHRKPNLIGSKPMVVLVDEDTRSAAEMLAGALRDNGRALVLGKQTYGKGVLQDTFSIGEHLAVKVVTAKYFLPDGTNIHDKGIQPDVKLDGDEEAQLSRAARLLTSAIAQAKNTGRRVLAVIEQSAGANL